MGISRFPFLGAKEKGHRKSLKKTGFGDSFKKSSEVIIDVIDQAIQRKNKMSEKQKAEMLKSLDAIFKKGRELRGFLIQ